MNIGSRLHDIEFSSYGATRRYYHDVKQGVLECLSARDGSSLEAFGIGFAGSLSIAALGIVESTIFPFTAFKDIVNIVRFLIQPSNKK